MLHATSARPFCPAGSSLLTESMPPGPQRLHGRLDRLPAPVMKPLEINGISHFVEHMVFKGTTSRSTQQIARDVDTIGGNLDAYTSKETVCFSIKVLDENVPPALDVLG